MTTSKTIAGLMGPTLVVIAAGMLVNLGSLPAMAEQVSRDPALIHPVVRCRPCRGAGS
jgi:hypothetical protein